jgi:hypothetical protein
MSVRSVLSNVVVLLALCPMLYAAGNCEDVLAAMHQKPKGLKFVTCKPRPDLQGQPMEATYRVPGTRAAEVEAYLVRELNVKKLHRTCCVWESMENSYRDKGHHLLIITMATEETLVDKREEWGKIPYFQVTVSRFLDDP